MFFIDLISPLSYHSHDVETILVAGNNYAKNAVVLITTAFL